MNLNIIRQSNARLWNAIASARIERNPVTMSEVYDALNARHRARNARLTESELAELDYAYRLSPAGH